MGEQAGRQMQLCVNRPALLAGENPATLPLPSPAGPREVCRECKFTNTHTSLALALTLWQFFKTQDKSLILYPNY